MINLEGNQGAKKESNIKLLFNEACMLHMLPLILEPLILFI